MNANTNKLRPFRFLIDQVGPEIRDAVEHMNEFGASRPDFIRYLADNQVEPITHHLATALRYATDRNVSLRIAALLTLSFRWPSDGGAIRKCMSTAFDDPIRRVRGFAWMAIGNMWQQSQSKGSFIVIGAEFMVAKFEVPEEPELPLIVHAWLDGVTRLLARARFSVRHTTQLAEFEARRKETMESTLRGPDKTR